RPLATKAGANLGTRSGTTEAALPRAPVLTQTLTRYASRPPGLSYRGVQASIMRYTKCKAWATVALTLLGAFVTVNLSAFASKGERLRLRASQLWARMDLDSGRL